LSGTFNEITDLALTAGLKKETPTWRTQTAAMAGVGAVALATLAYSFGQNPTAVVTQGSTEYTVALASLYLAVIVAGIALVAYDLIKFAARRITAIRAQGFARTSPGWLVPYTLSKRKYFSCFIVATSLYAIFYSIVTSMVVYQPTVDFVRAYGASIPSAVLTPCCGAPLYTPVLTVYVTDHLGLLLIPLTSLLLVAISILVGLNVAVSAFAFDNRAKGKGRGVAGALGAVVGLFTGCPTCAGIFFANTLGGSGAASFATLLGYYQPAFILLSLPVLLITPYLTARSLARVYRDGCVPFSPEKSTGAQSSLR